MENIAIKNKTDNSFYPQNSHLSTNMGVELVSAGIVFDKIPYHCNNRVRDDYLLLFTISGNAVVSEDHAYEELTEGNWFLLVPELVHSYRAVSPWSLAYIHFKGWLIDELLEKLGLFDIERLSFRQINSSAEKLIIEIGGSKGGLSLGEETHRNALFLQLLITLHQNYEWQFNRHGSLLNAEKFMDENYNKDISLDDLAKEANMSKFHFTRQFKKRFGYSPIKYLQKTRIEKAKNILSANSTIRIDEVSKLTGFTDPLYFSKVFKSIIGQSPRNFREKAKTEI